MEEVDSQSSGNDQSIESRVLASMECIYEAEFQKNLDLMEQAQKPNFKGGFKSLFHYLRTHLESLHFFLHNLMKTMFFWDNFRTKEEKGHFLKMEVFVKSSIVLFISFLPKFNVLSFKDVSQLLINYPMFDMQHIEENIAGDDSLLWLDLKRRRKNKRKLSEATPDDASQQLIHLEHLKLLRFRNYIKIAMQVIHPEGNKDLLLKIASRLEGAGESYITGGDPRPATRRRVLIFETESGVKARKKISVHLAAEKIANLRFNATPCGTMVNGDEEAPVVDASYGFKGKTSTISGSETAGNLAGTFPTSLQPAGNPQMKPLTTVKLTAAENTSEVLQRKARGRENQGKGSNALLKQSVAWIPPHSSTILHQTIECPGAPASVREIAVPEAKDLVCMAPQYTVYLNYFYGTAYWDKMSCMIDTSMKAMGIPHSGMRL